VEAEIIPSKGGSNRHTSRVNEVFSSPMERGLIVDQNSSLEIKPICCIKQTEEYRYASSASLKDCSSVLSSPGACINADHEEQGLNAASTWGILTI